PLEQPLISEHPQIFCDLLGAACRLLRIVGELHRAAPVRPGHLANQTNGIECVGAARMATAKVVGRERAPSVAVAHAAVELRMERDHQVDVETVAEHAAFLARIAAALQVPADHLLSGRERLLAVEAHSGPVGDQSGASRKNWVMPKVSGSMMRSSPS